MTTSPSESWTLEALEAAAYLRLPEEAMQQLHKLLPMIESFHNIPPGDPKAFCTRIVACLTSLLADPKFKLTWAGFQLFSLFSRALHKIFYLSGFRSADYLLPLIANAEGLLKGDTEFVVRDKDRLLKLLAVYSPASSIDLDFNALIEREPKEVFTALLGILRYDTVLDEISHARMEKMLAIGSHLLQAELPESQLGPFSNAWMLCSYHETSNRHEIKHWLNEVALRWMQAKGVRVPALPKRRQIPHGKPRLLVALEAFHSAHAMFRCYAPMIREMRAHFHLIGFGGNDCVDDIARREFDEVILIAEGPGEIRKYVGGILKAAPDMIYYPSLGMSAWAPMLCNLRLCPIQIMSFGHPASSCSREMDYAFTGEATVDVKMGIPEITITIPDEMVSYVPYPASLENVVKEVRLEPERIRLAIPAKSYKLKPGFMRLCKALHEKYGDRIDFIFFPHVFGIDYLYISEQINAWLPRAIIHPAMNYRDYMKCLSECDIQLGTFPFAGANSNVDALQLGLPLVSLIGNEPHERTDLLFHLRVPCLPEWLRTHDTEEYFSAVCRLIDNNEERVEISKHLLSFDVAKAITKNARKEGTPSWDAGDAMLWVYRNHEEIIASGKRIVKACESFDE